MKTLFALIIIILLSSCSHSLCEQKIKEVNRQIKHNNFYR